MKSKILLFIMVLVSLGVWVVDQIPDGRLHVVFCDVGQGDAELIVKGRVQVLIDGGPKAEKLLDCLGSHMPFWDRRIELVVNTHPQKDHIAGLVAVAERYEIGKLLIDDVADLQLKEYLELKKLIREKEIEIYQPQMGDRLRLSGLELAVLWPKKKVLGASTSQVADLNQWSIVLRLEYGEFEALFTGDIGLAEELALMGEGVITGMEVLKVAHHGSKYSSSADFVARLRPKLAVFEVGANNSYGHPNGDIVSRFEAVGAKVKRTDVDGTVEVISDGQRWWIK